MAIGSIVARDTDGTMTQTGPGTAGQVLTSNGAAAIPTFQNAATNGRSLAKTAAVASVVAVTVGAADESYLVSANVNVTTSTTHSFGVTVAYTDETNTARVLTLPVAQLAGTLITAITNLTGAGPYEGVALQIRCKAATTITVATAGTFTVVTYNVEGRLQQVA